MAGVELYADDRPAGSSEPAGSGSPTRPTARAFPQQHLKGITGILQADVYAGFGALYESGAIKEAACWAHARRQFYDLHMARPSAVTQKALDQIGDYMPSRPNPRQTTR